MEFCCICCLLWEIIVSRLLLPQNITIHDLCCWENFRSDVNVHCFCVTWEERWFGWFLISNFRRVLNVVRFFWVIPWCPKFICWHFGMLCLFHLHRLVGMKNDWSWECWSICMGKGLARKGPEPFTPIFSNPVILHTYPPMKMEQTEHSKTSAYKIQTPANYPEESIQQFDWCLVNCRKEMKDYRVCLQDVL